MTDNNRLTDVSTDKFEAHELGLVIKGKPTVSDWVEYGKKLRRVETSLNWIIGDYLVYGEFKYGEKYAQILDESMMNSWKVYHWVAKHVAPERREKKLSWTHHRLIASLPPVYQIKMLEKAVKEKLNTPELGKILRHVSDNVYDAVIRAEGVDGKNDYEVMDWVYKKQLKTMLDEAIEAGVPVEMNPEVYSMYVRLSGTGRCPHCEGIILLSDFFATKSYRDQDFVRSPVRHNTSLKPTDIK